MCIFASYSNISNIMISTMSNLTKNEIVALMHLADGEQHEDTPTAITSSQYYAALKSLKQRHMLCAAFNDGGEAEDAKLTMDGQARVDDLKEARERQLSMVLKENNLTMDQYNFLKQSNQENVDYNSSSIPFREFKNLIFNPLSQMNFVYAAPGSKRTEVVITSQGKQMLKEIEYDVSYRLAHNDEYARLEEIHGENKGENVNRNKKNISQVKITNRKKSLVVFALMALYRNQAFETNLDRDATIDHILFNALGEKENNNVDQILSPIFNRAKIKTPEVFINELVDNFREEITEALKEEKSKKLDKK